MFVPDWLRRDDGGICTQQIVTVAILSLAVTSVVATPHVDLPGSSSHPDDVVPEQVHVPEGGRGDGRPVEVGNQYYGVNGSKVIHFWSRDRDNLTDRSNATSRIDLNYSDRNVTDRTNVTRENVTSFLRAMANRSDRVWSEPVTAARRWNAGNWEEFRSEFSPDDDQNTSIMPFGIGGTDARFIKDAHATLYGIRNSTIEYRSEDTVVRHVRLDGAVRVLFDYRVRTPPDDTNGSDGFRQYWSVLDHEIKRTCVVRNHVPPAPNGTCTGNDEGNVVGVGAGSHVQTIDYELHNETQNLSVAAEYEVRVEVVNATRHTRECGTNDTCDNETYWTENRTTITENVTVVDTVENVDVGHLQMDVRRAVYPNGTAEFRIDFSETGPGKNETPAALWSTLSINGTSVSSRWGHFTYRDVRWDSIQRRVTGGPTESDTTVATPLRVAVVPSQNVSTEMGIIGPNRLESVNETVRNFTSPESRLPENVNIPLNFSGDRYRSTDGIVVRHTSVGYYNNGSGYDARSAGIGTLSASSIIESEPVHINKINRTITVERPSIDLTYISTEQGLDRVRVELTDADGDPIDTTEHVHLMEDRERGRIVFSGSARWLPSSVETNESGVAMISVESDEKARIEAVFRPKHWTKHSGRLRDTPAYVPARDTLLIVDSHPLTDLLLYLLEKLFLPVLLFATLYLLVRRDVIGKYA